MKGGIPLSAIGYIQVHAYTSNAQIPIKDVAITVTDENGTAFALRLTDRSGLIVPIPVTVPDRIESESPNPEEQPFALVNLYARKQGFEQYASEDVQVFAGITTDQDIELIPLAEFPELWNRTDVFRTPPQNL